MDSQWDTGDGLGAADSQTGEEATSRDPGNDTRTTPGDSDGGLEVTAGQTPGEDHTGGAQRNHEGNTGQDHPRKLKKGKRIQGASGYPATLQQRDQRFQRELEHLHKHPKTPDFRLQAPPRKPYQPYVFNSLRPYHSVSTIPWLADHVKGHRSRRTVFGLIEPWVDLRMGNDLQLDVNPDLVNHRGNKHTQKKASTKRCAASWSSACVQTGDKAKSPQLSTINPGTTTLSGKQLDNGDVSTLRLELGAITSQGARRKFRTDYEQTLAHFYRSQLHRLDQMHPASRQHACSSYLAYSQNTPGSRRAITDCMHQLTL